MANDPARTAKYASYLGSQTSAVFHFGTSASSDVGSVWYAPDQVSAVYLPSKYLCLTISTQGGSIFTPKTSTSGLEAHVAAAKYGPC